jgi:hypothetical protein
MEGLREAVGGGILLKIAERRVVGFKRVKVASIGK